ncbi:hypothetical protein [Streptomyces sp. HD]|uniref:hypothetical protein n=1 Tax=Streptomyces sp. HD TaxID=3020892 RepID=UPI0023315963|nr:hypothetical protein [Streptomyces sp. HD]MDC0770795.1 hypothetical protein [Streptomyces sp. HD]
MSRLPISSQNVPYGLMFDQKSAVSPRRSSPERNAAANGLGYAEPPRTSSTGSPP